MAIGGKEFKIEYEDTFPALRLDLLIGSPDPQVREKYVVRKALLDTGSDFTLIQNAIIELLQLKWTGTVMEIEGFSGEVIDVKFYSAKVIVDGIIEEILEIGGVDFEPLVGMDLIKKCHILINCPNGTFEVANKRDYKPPPD